MSHHDPPPDDPSPDGAKRPRRPRRPRRKRVGLAIDTVGSYGRGVLRGVMAWAKTHDWVVSVPPRRGYDEPPTSGEWEADGLITQVFTRAVDAVVADRSAALGVPVANVSNVAGGTTLPTVLPDDPAVGRVAHEYLAGRGFTRFAFYGYLTPGSYSERRRWGFRRAVEAGGGQWFERDAGEWAAGGPDAAGLGRWVRSLPEPVGVLCCNDNTAYALLTACARAGVAVPDDLAVLGVDDDELVNTVVTPSLSSITLPAARIGFEAARLLDGMMAGAAPPTGPTLFPPGGVVTRQSTDVSAVEDRDVAAALVFIRAHAAEPIGVDDVAEASATSRRSLERRFRRSLGRTVLGEMRYLRVERAKQLLATTELTMPQVAAASGFGDATRLGIVFRQLTGQPPTEYRRRVRPTPA